jgi:hypothetical protein
MPLKSLVATNQTQVLLVEPAVWMLTHSSFTAQSTTCDAIQDAPVGAQPTVWQISASVLKGAEAWWGKWWQTIGCLRQPIEWSWLGHGLLFGGRVPLLAQLGNMEVHLLLQIAPNWLTSGRECLCAEDVEWIHFTHRWTNSDQCGGWGILGAGLGSHKFLCH